VLKTDLGNRITDKKVKLKFAVVYNCLLKKRLCHKKMQESGLDCFWKGDFEKGKKVLEACDLIDFESSVHLSTLRLIEYYVSRNKNKLKSCLNQIKRTESFYERELSHCKMVSQKGWIVQKLFGTKQYEANAKYMRTFALKLWCQLVKASCFFFQKKNSISKHGI
jgi:hypothetical protein